MKNSKPSKETPDTHTKAKLGLTAAQLEAMANSTQTPLGRAFALAALNGYSLPLPPTRGEMVQLVGQYKRPSPLELAKLAAAIGQADNPDEAIRSALRLHLRATIFLNQHRNDSLADLALAAGDADLFFGADAAKRLGPPLRLEKDKRDDGARRYLRKRGIRLKKARSVKDNLLKWLRKTEMLVFLFARKQEPLNVQESMTARERDEAIEQQARKAGWNKSDSEMLARCKEKRSDTREVYLVPQAMLDRLVAMKKERKRSGGLKSLHTAALKKSSKSS
jgi:hypothetical protein